MNPWKFLAADAAGARDLERHLSRLGYIFRNQLELAAEQAGRMGSFLVLVIARRSGRLRRMEILSAPALHSTACASRASRPSS